MDCWNTLLWHWTLTWQLGDHCDLKQIEHWIQMYDRDKEPSVEGWGTASSTASPSQQHHGPFCPIISECCVFFVFFVFWKNKECLKNTIAVCNKEILNCCVVGVILLIDRYAVVCLFFFLFLFSLSIFFMECWCWCHPQAYPTYWQTQWAGQWFLCILNCPSMWVKPRRSNTVNTFTPFLDSAPTFMHHSQRTSHRRHSVLYVGVYGWIVELRNERDITESWLFHCHLY